MICHLYEAPKFLIFTSDVPALFYYSHIPVIFIAIFVGLFVYLSNKKSLLNKLFLVLLVVFSGWPLLNLLAWTSVNGGLLTFLWPLFGVFLGLTALVSIYFTSVLVGQRDISFKTKLLLSLLAIPLFLLAASNQGVSGFDLTACDALAYEGGIYRFYYNFLGVLAFVWNLVLLIRGYRVSEKAHKKQILYIGTGIEFFIGIFFFVVSYAIYLKNDGMLPDSSLEMYGLLGVLIFILFTTYSIVRFKAFNIRVATPFVLVGGLWVLIVSLLFLRNSEAAQVIILATLVLVTVSGWVLSKSVRKEIKHREQIERFAQKLRIANARLKELDKQKTEFVSIASHQLKSPLTAISGYSSMLKDGDFGVLPEGAKEPVERIYASARSMAESIEEYLNVSMIEAGSMKFSPTDFNLRTEVEHICNDLSVVAMKKGLLLYFKTSLASRAVVNADLGKIKQSIHNLISNAIKYTDKGKITVTIYDDLREKRIFVEVEDTGIGMTKNTLYNLFQKFERAENASRIDTQGVGLGLYVAYRLVESMGGSITAHSAGAGMGSKFIVELPLVM